MANNKTAKKTNTGKTANTDKGKRVRSGKQGKSNLPLFIAAVVILCAAIAVVVIPKVKKQDGESSGQADAQVIEEGGSLVIPVSEVSATAQFYPVEVDGTRMEVIAVEDSDGNVRTAFNTCQICYGSGRGYYVQDGNVLVCQNCGNRFTVNQVEIESGGCNPWPIFPENKTVTDDTIEISYDFLKESKEIFSNWKVSY